MASSAVSEIVDSLPPPFNSFGRIIWNGIEKEDDSPQKMLKILERIEKNDELQFITITADIKKLIESNATHDDIIEVGIQIRESHKEIVMILESKLDEILKVSKETLEDMRKARREIREVKLLLTPILDKNKNEEQVKTGTKQENYLSLYNEGNDLLIQGKLNRAIKSYKKSLKLAPDCFNALNNMGIAFDKLGKSDKALICYNQALKIKPTHVSSIVNIGILLGNRNQHHEAIDLYQTALKTQPKNSLILSNLGVELEHLGKYKDAFNLFRKAVNLTPREPMPYYNFANQLVRMKKYDDAISNYEKAIILNPDYIEAIENKARVHYRIKQYPEASDSFDKLIKLQPNNPMYSYLQAQIKMLQGKKVQSLHFLKKAIKLKMQFKEIAKEDNTFTAIKNDPDFKKLVN